MSEIRPWDQVRRFPARNTGTADIPPFGLVMLANKDGGYCQDWGHGDIVRGASRKFTNLNFYAAECPKNSKRVRFYVSRPEDNTGNFAVWAQAALFAVNGPVTIPVGGVGEVSQDWPLQVFHAGKYNVAPNGASCGPRAGSFGVWTPKGPFTIISHDPSDPIGDGLNHTVWIAPKGPTTSRLLWGDSVIGFNDAVPLKPSDNVWVGDSGEGHVGQGTTNAGAFSGVAVDNSGLSKFSIDGLYLITFSATIWSDTAPRGTKLGIAMQVLRFGQVSWETKATMVRYQDIEKDGGVEVFTTKENIATTVIVSAKQGDAYRFLSNSTYDQLLSDIHLGIVRLGNAGYGYGSDVTTGYGDLNDDPELEAFDESGGGPDPAFGNTPKTSGGSIGVIDPPGEGGGSHLPCKFTWNGTSWDLTEAGSCETACAPPANLDPGTPAGPVGYGTCADGEGEDV